MEKSAADVRAFATGGPRVRRRVVFARGRAGNADCPSVGAVCAARNRMFPRRKAAAAFRQRLWAKAPPAFLRDNATAVTPSACGAAKPPPNKAKTSAVGSAVLKKLDTPGFVQAARADVVPFALSFCTRCTGVENSAFSLKQSPCPHCGCRGALNRHSRSLGNDPASTNGRLGSGKFFGKRRTALTALWPHYDHKPTRACDVNLAKKRHFLRRHCGH